MGQNDFHISVRSDLDLSPSDLKIGLDVRCQLLQTSVISLLKFERCTIFHFRVNCEHRRDSRTDGRTDGRTDDV